MGLCSSRQRQWQQEEDAATSTAELAWGTHAVEAAHSTLDDSQRAFIGNEDNDTVMQPVGEMALKRESAAPVARAAGAALAESEALAAAAVALCSIQSASPLSKALTSSTKFATPTQASSMERGPRADVAGGFEQISQRPSPAAVKEESMRSISCRPQLPPQVCLKMQKTSA